MTLPSRSPLLSRSCWNPAPKALAFFRCCGTATQEPPDAVFSLYPENPSDPELRVDTLKNPIGSLIIVDFLRCLLKKGEPWVGSG